MGDATNGASLAEIEGLSTKDLGPTPPSHSIINEGPVKSKDLPPNEQSARAVADAMMAAQAFLLKELTTNKPQWIKTPQDLDQFIYKETAGRCDEASVFAINFLLS